MLFNCTVKSHMVAHICLKSNILNPRKTWCFSGERMMLLMRRIVQSCARGTGPVEINWKVIEKYRQAMHLSLSDLLEWNDLAELWEEARDDFEGDYVLEDWSEE